MSIETVEKRWYVYFLCDPDTEKPFYIGKGTGNRIDQHERLINSRADRNQAKKDAILAIHNRGKQVLKKKVAEFEDEQDAYIYEWGMICLYYSMLTNIYLGAQVIAKAKRHLRVSSTDTITELPECFWTTGEVAQFLHCGVRFVTQLIEEKRLRHVLIEKRYLFNPNDVYGLVGGIRSNTDELVTVKQSAAFLTYKDVHSVLNLLNSEKLKGYRVGNRWLVWRSDLIDYINSH